MGLLQDGLCDDDDYDDYGGGGNDDGGPLPVSPMFFNL